MRRPLNVQLKLFTYGVIMQVNPELIGKLEEAGLKFVGKDESGKRMEVCISYPHKISRKQDGDCRTSLK